MHSIPRVSPGRFDLSSFPAAPPRKWLERGDNVVQVQLMLTGVTSLSLEGASTDSRVDLTLVGDGTSVRARTAAGSTTLDIRADGALITSISAYHTEVST